MKTSRLVWGIVAVVLGMAMFWGSLSILGDERDADDFFVSSEQVVDRSSVAIASEEVNVLKDAPGWLADLLTNPVDVRVRGASGDAGAIFFGIADSSDVASYLSGVNYDEVTSIDFRDPDLEYSTHDGTASPSAPGLADIGVASTEGSGEQTLDWSIEAGEWSLVVMNADASAGIEANLVFGAKISNFVLVMWVGLVMGLVGVLGGGFMLYRGFSRSPSRSIRRVSTPTAELISL